MSYRKSLIFFSLLIGVAPAYAQNPADRTHLQKIEENLSSQRDEVVKLTKKADLTRDELQALREKMVASTEILQQKQAEQETLETRLADLEKQTHASAEKMKGSQDHLRLLTQTLTRLARIPPEIFLLRIESIKEHVHRVILLRALLPKLRDETAQIAEKLAELEQLRTQVAEQKKLVADANKNLESQKRNLDDMIQLRQGSLQKTVAEREAIAQQLSELATEAKDLRQLLDKVNKKMAQSERDKDDKPTVLGKNLKQPVSGKLIRSFGTKDETGIESQGLTYTSAAESPIVAPRKGKIVFAGNFRGYGQIVILQHTNSYHSFLAGFGRIDAEMHQMVEAGEPLGIMPSKATSGRAAPELYFEWRHNGEPVNPL